MILILFIPAVIGFIIGWSLSWWRAVVIGAAAAAGLLLLPGGIYIAEFPFALIAGGAVGGIWRTVAGRFRV